MVGQVVCGLNGTNEPHVVIIITMARQVEWPHPGQVCLAILHHVATFAHQAIDGAHDVLLVAWDRVGAKDHHIASLDLDELMRPRCHAVEHGTKLPLATRADDGDLVVGQLHEVFHLNHCILRDLDSASA